MGADSALDNILSEVGEFGPFQVVTLLAFAVMKGISGPTMITYMITATPLNYRCKVPECEVGKKSRDLPYDQPWLKNAIPSIDGKFDSCHRYAPKNKAIIEPPNQCSADLFDTSVKVTCSEYIHETDERNIQTEFNIHCTEKYKLALVGTIGNLARFLILPFSGLLSDRFGRLPCIVFGIEFCSLFGLIKTFSTDYYMYLVFEFLEASSYACCLTCIYVLAMEWASSKYRLLGNTVLSISFSVGEILFALTAMYVHDFRTLLRIFYAPGLFALVYFWLVPESVRWLLVTARVDRAIKTLKWIAKWNGRELSEKTIAAIRVKYSENANDKQAIAVDSSAIEKRSVFQLLCTILRTRALCIRFALNAYQWAASSFSYYGLSQSSTQIAGTNRYISFIIVMGIEIPSKLLAQYLMLRFKRKVLLFVAFSLAATAIIATAIIPKEYSWAVLSCFVVGKGAISFAYMAMTAYTTEVWPTSIRLTITNTCSSFARFGSMLAPFVVILGTEYGPLPVLLFGGTAVIAAISMLFSPETFGKQLPDTFDEANKNFEK